MGKELRLITKKREFFYYNDKTILLIWPNSGKIYQSEKILATLVDLAIPLIWPKFGQIWSEQLQ